MRVAALLGAVLVLTAVGGPPAAAGAPGTLSGGVDLTMQPDDALGLPVEVDVVEVAPQVLRPGDDLRVRAVIRNVGEVAVTAPRVSLLLSRGEFISRSRLAQWADANPFGPAGFLADYTDLDEPLGPGAERAVELTVPANGLGLPMAWSQWGPRGVAVAVSQGGTRLGLERTFVVWLPGADVPTTRLSVLAPLTPAEPAPGPLVEPPGAEGPDDVPTTADRIGAVLAATADHPDVGLVVDPSLLVGGPWVDDLTGALPGRDVFGLPFGDPDLAALAHADRKDLLRHAQTLTRDLAATHGPLRTDLAWPADGEPDLATVAWAARSGTRAVVVGPEALTPAPVLTYTPTGRAAISTDAGEVTALIADEVLSRLLTHGDDATPAVAAQRVLAETAVIARERPAEPRHVLATLPRDWFPDPEVASAQLAALEHAPWVTPISVSALLGTADPLIDRAPLPESRVAGAEASPELLEDLAVALRSAQRFASIVPDPEQLLGESTAELLRPASVAARGHVDRRAGVATRAIARITEVTEQVSLVRGSVVNLISASGELPIAVRNQLDQPVTVTLVLRPDSRALTVESTVDLEIPAGQDVSARVPVHAVASDDVDIEVLLLNADGEPVRSPDRFTVRVRADWEDRGTAVLAGLLAVGVVVGVWRSIRRGKLSTRASTAQVPVDVLTTPEESESSPGSAR